MRNASEKHGGDMERYMAESGLSPDKILDFSASLNPLGPPAWLKTVIDAACGKVGRYPDPRSIRFVEKVAGKLGVSASNVLAGNGATELLRAIPAALKPKRALIPSPSYIDYEAACKVAGIPIERMGCHESQNFAITPELISNNASDDDLVFIGRPNNPTGGVMDANELRDVAVSIPGAMFVVDESFGGFVDGFESVVDWNLPNIITVVSLTKLFCVPGLRIGYMVAEEDVIKAVSAHVPPWSVNVFAQAAGIRAMDDDEYIKKTVDATNALRDEFSVELLKIPGLKVYPASANYLLIRIERGGITAKDVYGKLIRQGIAIRVCDNFAGLGSRHFRVAVRMKNENGRLCAALAEIFK